METFSLLIISDKDSGAASICSRYIDDECESKDHNSWTGRKYINQQSAEIIVNLWIERHFNDKFGRNAGRHCDGCVLIYDKSNEQSFKSVLKSFQQFLDQDAFTAPDELPVMILGNKYDLIYDDEYMNLCLWDIDYDPVSLTIGYIREMEIKLQNVHIPFDLIELCWDYLGAPMIAEKYANENGMMHFDVSAKTGYNVDRAFNSIFVRAKEYHDEYGYPVLTLAGDDRPRRSVGCAL